VTKLKLFELLEAEITRNPYEDYTQIYL